MRPLNTPLLFDFKVLLELSGHSLSEGVGLVEDSVDKR